MRDMKKTMQHLKDHVKYPASKRDVIEACNNMEDIPMEEKKYFEATLPEGTYGSADDVMKALGDMSANKMHAM